jgi:hypothetical protein
MLRRSCRRRATLPRAHGQQPPADLALPATVAQTLEQAGFTLQKESRR